MLGAGGGVDDATKSREVPEDAVASDRGVVVGEHGGDSGSVAGGEEFMKGERGVTGIDEVEVARELGFV